jgi:hypothetical protein
MLAVIAYQHILIQALEEIMNAPHDFSKNGKTGLNPVLITPDEYSLEVPLVCWLFLFGTVGFTLHESLQSFLSTGRIWPVIFILVLFLLLGNCYLEMKQRKHAVAILEQEALQVELKSEIIERDAAPEHQLRSAIRRLGRYFKLERDCGI